MINAKQLTSTAWMLSDTKTEKSIGMVNFRNDKFYLMGNKEPFDSLEAIASFYGTELKDPDDETNDSEVITEINGYPIKHRFACEIETKYIGDIAIETYKTKPGSKKVYAAGYYGLTFKASPLGCGMGVLFQTLVDTGFIGPYKTELDMQFAANKYNNETKNDQ